MNSIEFLTKFFCITEYEARRLNSQLRDKNLVKRLRDSFTNAHMGIIVAEKALIKIDLKEYNIHGQWTPRQDAYVDFLLKEIPYSSKSFYYVSNLLEQYKFKFEDFSKYYYKLKDRKAELFSKRKEIAVNYIKTKFKDQVNEGLLGYL